MNILVITLIIIFRNQEEFEEFSRFKYNFFPHNLFPNLFHCLILLVQIEIIFSNSRVEIWKKMKKLGIK